VSATYKLHSRVARLSCKSSICNLISEMARFDSPVPPATPAQSLPGLFVMVLGSPVSLATGLQMAG